MSEQNEAEQKENSAVVEEAQLAATEESSEPGGVDTNLEELVTFLKNADGYLATVTILSNGKLNRHLITKNFPDLDILKSIAAVEKMSVERLKAL